MFLVIGRLQNWCSDAFFVIFFFVIYFFANREICDTWICRDKVWWLREASQSGKHSYPYVKKSFKTQHGTIAIDPAILAAIGHRFIAKNRKKY